MQINASTPGNELSAELRVVLIDLGHTLGTIAVYGANHPSAEKAIEVTFANLQTLLKTSGSLVLGSANSKLTVDGKPFVVKDAPTRALEKRLTALQLSHVALNKGLSIEEFKALVTVLCVGTEQQVKKALSESGLTHINIEDVKYVALREGENSVSKGADSTGGTDGNTTGGTDRSTDGLYEIQDESPSTQVELIGAFLQGEPGGGADANLISTVLENLSGLKKLANSSSAEAKNAVKNARQGISDYVYQVGSQIDEMENKVQQSAGEGRDQLILEISKLTLSLMQPLTVINGSIEAALITPDEALHKDLLDIAYQSGQSLDAMTKRMITLTGYPELSEADDHLNDWNKSQ